MNENLKILLRVAVGTATPDEVPPIDDEEWARVYEECGRQTLLGVVADAAGRLTADRRPPQKLWMQWLAVVARIQGMNRLIDAEAVRLTRLLDSVGLRMRVLKGQHVARYYPDPSLRQPGDIDAWVTMDGTERVSRQVPEIFRRISSLGEGGLESPTYHHVEWNAGPVSVEVHYRPSFFFNPLANRRFQRWAKEWGDNHPSQTGVTWQGADFDRVYLLVHIYRHIISEGVGLRQLMDYAMLLVSHPVTHAERDETARVLRRLQMTGVARAVMYAMREVFAIPDSMLILPPDEKTGRKFLAEVCRSGNFGHHDDRINTRRLGSESGSFWLHTKRRARYLFAYPQEIVFDVPFRLWHYQWRKKRGRGMK
ncbi:MAG: nucleotidyltransferase family protein [Bacteroidaceae bacterium]|nr:nucleotidyltransferase family protein [Bacteroidaceae bacterium]